MEEKAKKGRAKYVILLVLILGIAIGAYVFVSNNPSNKLAKQLELGEKYLLEENYEQAIVAFSNVIKIDANNARAYNVLVDIYLAQGNYEAASDILNQGIGITEDAELKGKIFVLGEKFLSVENYEQAIEAFKSVIEYDAGNVEAYGILVDIYLAQGNYEEAGKILEQGIAMTQDEGLQKRAVEITMIQETGGICTEIINNCNSKNYEQMWNEAYKLYVYMDSALGDEKKDVLIPTKQGTVGVHILKGHYYQIYYGDYVNGVRDGKGVCAIILDSFSERHMEWAVGAWKNDMPNGIQTAYIRVDGTYNGEPDLNIWEYSGNVTDGLWDGEVSFEEEVFVGDNSVSYIKGSMNYKNGKPQIIEYRDDRGQENMTAHLVGYGYNENGNVEIVTSRSRAEREWGILGYCNIWGGMGCSRSIR